MTRDELIEASLSPVKLVSDQLPSQPANLVTDQPLLRSLSDTQRNTVRMCDIYRSDAEFMDKLGISYEYEQKLSSKDDPNDFRLPDFTVSYEGDTFYWEHLGMLSVPSYKEQWDRKRQWYEDNGYLSRVITSEDGPDGSIDAAEIERRARSRIVDAMA